jgi:hypothetical protein
MRENLDLISSRFKVDKDYTQRFFTDFTFAKNELTNAGLSTKMISETYHNLRQAYRQLNYSNNKPVTFEMIWDESPHKGKPDSKRTPRKLLIVSCFSAVFVFSIAISIVLARLSKK